MKPKHHKIALAAIAALSITAKADITVNVDEAAEWLGYMNVSELPENGGGFVFGSGWGTADLQASFTDSVLTLAPNIIGDPDPFWYIGGGAPGNPGNKIMDASMYVEPPAGTLSGQNVTFTGTVTANSLTSSHTAIAFIKDFAPDYSSFNVVTAPLVEGVFSISMDTINDPGRHVQYGFQTIGVNVWATDVDPFGSVQIQAAPPSPNATINPTANWKGSMNVYNLPAPDGDGALFLSSDWGTEDLSAVFNGAVLTLRPNSINPPDGLLDEDYYREDESGNKIMEATMFVETPPGSLAGQTVTFSGTITSNSLTSAHEVTAFIKDFSADYSTFEIVSVPLVNGSFDISLEALEGVDRHVQYGFQMVGVNVWMDHLEDFGIMELTATVAPDSYTAWIESFDFSAIPEADLTRTGDPDGDGRSNLDEFALDGNPASAEASGKIRIGVENLSGDQALVLTLPVRGNPLFEGATTLGGEVDDILYIIEGSNDLDIYDEIILEVTPAVDAGLPPLNTGWNYRSFRLDGSITGESSRGPRGFIRTDVIDLQ